MYGSIINSPPPGQNGHHFANIFEYIFMNEKSCILIQISLKFVSKGPISQHWFRLWLGAEQAASLYLNQCWPYAAPGGDELREFSCFTGTKNADEKPEIVYFNG